MDSELYKNSIEYEKLTQAIYQSILCDEGLERIKVEHNGNMTGRSGVAHQIDAYWSFKQAMVEHTVLIECKNYATAITLEKIRSFHSVINDIGNCNGIMVTKVGFQRGAKQYAEFYGIDLKLLRKPIDEDWNDKIRDIYLEITPKAPVSTPDKPISMKLFLTPESEIQKAKIKELQESGRLNIPSGPEMCFLDRQCVPITKEMKWWIPEHLEVLDKEPGGPYKQRIELKNTFVLINPETEDEQLVKVGGVEVLYWVEEFDTKEVAIHGNEIVKAILKDFSTGETEYVQRKD